MNCSKLTSLLFLFFWPSLCLLAQKNFEAGIFLGFANYQGDLAENHVEIGETRLAYGGFLRYTFNHKIGVKANIYNGEIAGDDANADNPIFIRRNGTERIRDWAFRANLTEMQLQLEWYPFAKPRFNKVGIFQPQITPYFSTGIGVALADAKLAIPVDDAELFPEEGDTNAFFNIPVGAGIRFDISEYFLMSFEFASRTVFNDYLDGVSENGRRDKQDWYMFGGVTFSFLFGPQVDFGFN